MVGRCRLKPGSPRVACAWSQRLKLHCDEQLTSFPLKFNMRRYSMVWLTKGAETGLPKAMFNLGNLLDQGNGIAAPNYTAAAGWYRRAADAGHGRAAGNLASMYTLGRGRAWQNTISSS
jgi:TPR repeat protein